MKKITLQFTILFLSLSILIASCKPEKQQLSKFQMLCKTWQIEKLMINDTIFPLTAQDLTYTVTYRKDSSYTDSDGMAGHFALLNDGALLVETLKTGGNGTMKYSVEALNNSNLNLKVVSDSIKNINMRYYYHAK
jgi:hypothetical protein